MYTRTFLWISLVYKFSLIPITNGDDALVDKITSLISRVEILSDRVEHIKILDKAFKMAVVDEKLKDLTIKMDNMQRQMNTLEVSLLNEKTTTVNDKLEGYAQKIIDQQNVLRNEAREQYDSARTFKGTVEAGMNKIFSRLDSLNRNSKFSEDDSIFVDTSQVKQAIMECSSASSSTKERLDDFFTDMLNEWTTSHRQIRQIDIKLDKIQNASSSHTKLQVINNLFTRLNQEIQLLEEIEPKLIHIGQLIHNVKWNTKAQKDSSHMNMIFDNLRSTVEGLQTTFQERLASLRESFEDLESVVTSSSSYTSKARSTINNLTDAVNHITEDINKKIDQKLSEVGNQVQRFLSAEVLATLNMVGEQFQKASESLKLAQISETNWRLNVERDFRRMTRGIDTVITQTNKCLEPGFRIAHMREIARMMKNIEPSKP